MLFVRLAFDLYDPHPNVGYLLVEVVFEVADATFDGIDATRNRRRVVERLSRIGHRESVDAHCSREHRFRVDALFVGAFVDPLAKTVREFPFIVPFHLRLTFVSEL